MLLAVTLCGLVAGGMLHLAGLGGAGNAVWLATGACGAAYALWAMADALRRGGLAWTPSPCWPWWARWRSENCSPRR